METAAAQTVELIMSKCTEGREETVTEVNPSLCSISKTILFSRPRGRGLAAIVRSGRPGFASTNHFPPIFLASTVFIARTANSIPLLEYRAVHLLGPQR